MKKYNIFNPIFVAILLIIFVFVYLFLIPSSAKNYLVTETFIGKWLTPSRNSLKKIFNMAHLPYWFYKSKLPALYIEISTSNQQELMDNIPFDGETLSYKAMLDEDKKYVKASFISPADNYNDEVKIRYRGLSPVHWNAAKKSYRINFPNENSFNGMDQLDLIIPDDRDYFLEMLNSYRAKKLGLLPIEFKLVRLFINGMDHGVYLASEPWSKVILARNGMIDTSNILSVKDLPSQEYFESVFKKDKVSSWKSYTNEDATSFEELKALLTLLEDANDQEFHQKIGELVDLDKFYRWQLVYALAGSDHVMDYMNFVFVFNQITGKFEFLPFDVAGGPVYSYDKAPTLAKRILSDEKTLKKYQKVVDDYISDKNNLDDDLQYYDGLYNQYFFEFYKDQIKIDPDFVFDKKIEKYRTWLVDNFYGIKEQTANLNADSFKQGGEYKRGPIVLEGSFKYFNDIFLNIDEFLLNNPQFIKKNQNTLIITSGTHIFNKNVIIPKDLRLVIEPGATLLMAPKVSIISYSPVTAWGNTNLPIMITALNTTQPWGCFGIINTGDKKNYFNFIRVSGGSGWNGSTTEPMNGVPFIAQFSLQNANTEVYNSIFERSNTDDAFHAIWGSVIIKYSTFRNTYSDGLDLDAVKNSQIIGNKFYNNDNKNGIDGDGLDISSTIGLEILDNQISNFGDKCISVGEKASVIIRNNILAGCNYGIAIKDASEAEIDKNIIIGNKTGGLTLYRKKTEFIKGGNANVTNSILWGNGSEILIDETTYYPTKSGGTKMIETQGVSTISVNNSTIKGDYNGMNIKNDRPNFEKLLPANLLKYVNL
jgi:parallel beta-helix repeat protein